MALLLLLHNIMNYKSKCEKLSSILTTDNW